MVKVNFFMFHQYKTFKIKNDLNLGWLQLELREQRFAEQSGGEEERRRRQ